MNSTLLTVLTAHNCHASRDAMDAAVAARFREILPGLRQKDGDFDYDGSRCRPENLGWRVRQNFWALCPKEVAAGQHDYKIEITWHDAARAQHWYMNEKQWD